VVFGVAIAALIAAFERLEENNDDHPDANSAEKGNSPPNAQARGGR